MAANRSRLRGGGGGGALAVKNYPVLATHNVSNFKSHQECAG